MVKIFFLAVLFCFSAKADFSFYTVEEVPKDPLVEKIEEFISAEKYSNNQGYIETIFDPKTAFYKYDRIDTLKVLKTLKENSLLNLSFGTPQEFQLNFKADGSALFFVKILSDVLSSLGYYNYSTAASKKDTSEFLWSIKIKSKETPDPLTLAAELLKNGCSIIDIEKNSLTQWSYTIDISRAKLNFITLFDQQKVVKKRSLYEHWFDISNINALLIKSNFRNSWHPYVTLYDENLHLIKVIKKDTVQKRFYIRFDENVKYVKISDLYTLKNIKDELVFYPKGSR